MDVRPLNGLIPQHHQPQPNVQNPNPPPPPPSHAEAPPKQVATAMERLSEAARLISDIRMGADRLLEALFIAANPRHANKPEDLFRKEDASMRQHHHDLRSIGRQLEESGVLNESLRSRSNSWGLHLPVVCPDGAVVAYAWKRQLAGQAGASAVDRTRLALKAFGDQKRRFFPHLDDKRVDGQSTDSSSSKRPCLSRQVLQPTSRQEDVSECKTLVDVLARMEKEMPNVKVLTYERLGWSKRALSLPTSENETALEDAKGVAFHGYSKLMAGVRDGVAMDKVSVLELLVPSVFRCVVSLHPAGSMEPDAVAFFSPDEGGSYIHARGVSVHHVFRQITEHAGVALQHFLGIGADTALYTLLHWICSYQTLLSKVCSKCGRLLAMDQRLSLLLPPVHRSYRYFSPMKASSKPQTTKERSADIPEAYHIGCLPENL